MIEVMIYIGSTQASIKEFEWTQEGLDDAKAYACTETLKNSPKDSFIRKTKNPDESLIGVIDRCLAVTDEGGNNEASHAHAVIARKDGEAVGFNSSTINNPYKRKTRRYRSNND